MKGYELIKMLQEGKIQEGTVIQDNYNTYIYEKDKILEELTLFIKSSDNSQESPDYSFFADIKNNFEIIEDEKEIDIQSIDIIRDYRTSEDDLYNDNFEDFRGTINELVQAVKQLDKNIKELR